MKIIERKVPPDQWPRKFTCELCASVLEVDANDISLPGQRDSIRGWFRCPVCVGLNYLSNNDTQSASRCMTNRRNAGYHPGG